MKQNYSMSPDDLDELKLFAETINKTLMPSCTIALIQRLITLSLGITKILDSVQEELNKGKDNSTALTLSCTILLYKFLKLNEHAVVQLLSIDAQGQPFLNDTESD